MKKYIFLLTLLHLSAVRAQDKVQDISPAIQDSVRLHEVVVNARLNRPFSYFCGQKAQVSTKEVNFYMPQTTADLLSLSGNVYMQKSQMAGGSPMIRGFATNRLLYSMDGIRMNTAIFRAGNLHNVISFDPFAIENTEVLFGPNSVLYGSDALGGVMNFSTLKPQLSQNGMLAKGNAIARYSSANEEKTLHFDIRLGWKKWALLTSLSHFNFGDIRIGQRGPEAYTKPFIVEHLYKSKQDIMHVNPNPNKLSPTGYSQYNIMQKILYAPNQDWRIEYDFHLSETSNLPRYDRLFPTNPKQPDQALYAEFYYGPQKWMMNHLSLNNKTSNPLYDEMTLHLALQHLEESRISRKFAKEDLKKQKENVIAYSLNLDLYKKATDKLQLFYGLEYVCNDVNSRAHKTNIISLENKASTPRYAQSLWSSTSAYITANYALLPSLHLLSGLRYNFNYIRMDFAKKMENIEFQPLQKSHNGAISGNIGVSYDFLNNWNARINYSRGFRSPNVDDFSKTFEQTNGYIVMPNADIQPEYANNYEIGLAKVKGKNLTFDISAYFTSLNNVILLDYFTINGSDTFEGNKIKARQNGKSAYLYGASLAAKALLYKGLSLSTHMNYQMGKETTLDGIKSTMPHVAPFFGDLRLAYEQEKFRLELYTIFNAKMSPKQMPAKIDENEDNYLRDGKGRLYAPGWATVNFKGMYKINKNIDISMGIENIADVRYRVYRSGVPSAGRNFVAAFAYRFNN